MRITTSRAVSLAALAALLFAVASIGYMLRALLTQAFKVNPSRREYDLVAEEVTATTVALRPASGRAAPGWDIDVYFGLMWDGGYGRLGRILERGNGYVVRQFKLLHGELDPGTRVRVDSFAFPADPLTAHSLDFDEVEVPGELCPLPAWQLTGDRDTWVIFVHGKGAWRGEALRVLPAVRAEGMPALAITYRGDEGALPDASGRYGYGHHEWRDLECAVQFALDHGADGVVLFGYSMGGGIIMSFLRNSALAPRARAAVLDSPMLNLLETVRFRTRKFPRPLTESTWKTARLTGIDWRNFDYLRDLDNLSLPILLFHGDADADVPVATSDALAAARPDIVRYVRVPGAGHVLSWNTDPPAYEQHVRDFLSGVLDAPPTSTETGARTLPA